MEFLYLVTRLMCTHNMFVCFLQMKPRLICRNIVVSNCNFVKPFFFVPWIWQNNIKKPCTIQKRLHKMFEPITIAIGLFLTPNLACCCSCAEYRPQRGYPVMQHLEIAMCEKMNESVVCLTIDESRRLRSRWRCLSIATKCL